MLKSYKEAQIESPYAAENGECGMSTCREKMLDLMVKQDIFVYFYIDYEANEWHLEENPALPEFVMSDNDNPIEDILKSGRVAEEDRERFQLFANMLSDGSALVGKENELIKTQIRLRYRNDTAVWYEINIYLKKVDYSKRMIITGTFHRMTEKEIQAKDILNLHTNDRSPALFSNMAKKHIEENPDKNFAYIQFDVVGFKFINDKYGEEVGNELLSHFQEVLSVYCNDEQIFTRLGADVFMLVISYDEVTDIYSFIRGLEAGLSGFRGIRYSFVFGVYLVKDRTLPPRTMSDSAAIARVAIKGNALENIGFFNQDVKSHLKTRRSIEDRMKSALENGEFVMYLQPKYSISNTHIIGAEALVRWIDPEKGLIPPNDFVPVFEKNGFIVKIDEYIWECACKQIKKWIDQGLPPIPISVNVSRVHLADTHFVDRLNELIGRYNIPKELLELEITETADNINANEMIQLAKDSGFRLLMDDFGSGYSSLNTLKSTPFDVLKIDRSFLSESMESNRGQKIISHTIAMSKDIGLDLIAEGVETKEQADFLFNCGCNAAQGFLYSRPVPVDMFEKLIVL